jgi:hypothetical protein
MLDYETDEHTPLMRLRMEAQSENLAKIRHVHISGRYQRAQEKQPLQHPAIPIMREDSNSTVDNPHLTLMLGEVHQQWKTPLA